MITDKYKEVWNRRHLINYMVKSDMQTKFYKSLLGNIWNAIIPLSQIGIYYFLLAVVFSAGGSRSGTSFLTITMGIMHYGILHHVASSVQSCIISHSSLLLQIKLEPIVLIAAGFIRAIKTAAFGIGIFCIVYFLLNSDVSYKLMVYPLILILWITFCWTIGLFISIVTVFFRDLLGLFPIFLQVLMYASPVIYSFSMFEIFPKIYQELFVFNPITAAFMLFQWCLLGLEIGIIKPLTILISWIIFGFVVGHRIYEWGRPRITKVL